MKINFFTLILLLGTVAGVRGQQIYDVALIPAELVKNATVVVRNEEQILSVKNERNATYTYKTAITILSENGENSAVLSEYYDKFSTVYNLKATMYDAKGIKIKSYKTSDYKDESITSSGTMYDDSRMKKLVFLNSTYPFTVEYSYEKDYNGYLSFPSWYPVNTYDCAVEKSSYTIEMPKNLTFKYLKSKDLKTDSALVGTKMVYKWSCQNISPFEYEPMSTGLQTITPWVMSSPDKFEYDNVKGNVENWKNLGAWTYQLSNDPQVLPENVKAEVKKLISNAKTDQEKIAVLYSYLQSHTRYVGIQLGIGGFKPITAARVATVNYGDCKALSNYMKTLLAEAGIPSQLVILGSGKPSLNPKYASFGQANHMILCVPSKKDTTWLECTSQYVPVGFVGNDNANRTVLLVTPEGGKLIQTPVYKPEDNFQNTVAKVALTAEGTAKIYIQTNYGAAQYEDHLFMTLLEPADQRKRLLNNLGIPNMEIVTSNFVQADKTIPQMQGTVSLTSNQLLSQGADKLFLVLNLLNRTESVPVKVENRKTPFAQTYGFMDNDEIIYSIPEGYKIEFIPKDIVLESEFGKYMAKAIVKDNTIIYKRTKMINSKKFAAEKYNELVSFYKKIYLADKQKAILAKIQ
jgi:transglutaminase-like putative cysteine protease